MTGEEHGYPKTFPNKLVALV